MHEKKWRNKGHIAIGRSFNVIVDTGKLVYTQLECFCLEVIFGTYSTFSCSDALSAL